jgi:hypothetical protein
MPTASSTMSYTYLTALHLASPDCRPREHYCSSGSRINSANRPSTSRWPTASASTNTEAATGRPKVRVDDRPTRRQPAATSRRAVHSESALRPSAPLSSCSCSRRVVRSCSRRARRVAQWLGAGAKTPLRHAGRVPELPKAK